MSKLVTIEHDISVECGECGGPVASDYVAGVLAVYPCKTCNKAAYDSGVGDGKEEARTEASDAEKSGS